MTDASPRYRRWVAAAAAELLWVHTDDGAVLLHRPSGKTHFLNPASVWLLEQLAQQPLDSLSAASALAERECVVVDEPFIAEVQAILGRFDELGLVRALVE